MRHILCALAFVIRWASRLLMVAIVLLVAFLIIYFVLEDVSRHGWGRVLWQFSWGVGGMVLVFVFCGLAAWASDYKCKRKSGK